jgi:hypothetical protein
MTEKWSRRWWIRGAGALSILFCSVLFAIAAAVILPRAFLTTASQPPDGASPSDEARPASLPGALVASHSNLESVVYPAWQRQYLEAGGDRNVIVGLGSRLGMATEYSRARGTVKLDLIGGTLVAHVEGLGDEPADLWLVDDSDGLGMTSIPERGDHMVRAGRLVKDDAGAGVSAELGAEFFEEFELDTVVVSRADRTPADSRLLLGTRPFFERVYTKTRLVAERNRPRGLLALLVSLLSPRPAHADSTQILIAHGLVSKAVGDGGDLFFRGTFSGNNRTCGTCHRVDNNLVIDVPFINTLPSSDPLFVAEPGFPGGVPGLERPLLMRGHGLILENVDGAENPTVKFVMRGVPHSLSMSRSVLAPVDGRAPVERTGWSGDGAPDSGALRLFANGAIFQHFTKSLKRVAGEDFVLATQAQLDAVEAYMRATGRLNELNVAGASMTDAGAERGRRIFNNNNTDPTIASGKCLNCHFNAGANVANGQNRNFNTGIETLKNPARDTEDFPFDGGFGITDRDCDADELNDCFGDGTFNTPPLIEAADTAPFFHNNAIPTVELAVEFYSGPEFRASPSGGTNINLTVAESADVAAFLRVINASFNADMAIQRNSAGITLENSSGCGGGGGGDPTTEAASAPVTGDEDCLLSEPGGDTTGKRQTINRLLALSNDESQDAINVLSARSLHPDAVTLLQSAISKNKQAIQSNQSQERKDLMISARNDLIAAKAKFGSGLSLMMGDGNLLF